MYCDDLIVDLLYERRGDRAAGRRSPASVSTCACTLPPRCATVPSHMLPGDARPGMKITGRPAAADLHAERGRRERGRLRRGLRAGGGGAAEPQATRPASASTASFMPSVYHARGDPAGSTITVPLVVPDRHVEERADRLDVRRRVQRQRRERAEPPAAGDRHRQQQLIREVLADRHAGLEEVLELVERIVGDVLGADSPCGRATCTSSRAPLASSTSTMNDVVRAVASGTRAARTSDCRAAPARPRARARRRGAAASRRSRSRAARRSRPASRISIGCSFARPRRRATIAAAAVRHEAVLLERQRHVRAHRAQVRQEHAIEELERRRQRVVRAAGDRRRAADAARASAGTQHVCTTSVVEPARADVDRESPPAHSCPA